MLVDVLSMRGFVSAAAVGAEAAGARTGAMTGAGTGERERGVVGLESGCSWSCGRG